MKTGFLAIVIIHGLIHLLGFVKAFDLREIREISLPISKVYGMIWLLAAILIVVYAYSYMAQSKYNWLLGLFAILISQFLIICFWKDAKFATIPNLIILVAVLSSYGNFSFGSLIEKETRLHFPFTQPGTQNVLSHSQILSLPNVVQKWLRRSGVVGREMLYSGRIEQKLSMKLKPDQRHWYSAKALQYTHLTNPSFIWIVDMNINKLVRIRGRDKFIDGQGEVLIKMHGLINLVKAQGEQINEGTLQRYLGEMVWFPSLATSPYISWEPIDDYSVKATMNYKGTVGSGVFFFNENGDFVKFSAMRFKDNQPNAQRYEWILTVDGYKLFEGIKVPSKMKATWKLAEGDWTWLDLEIVDLKYNEAIR